MDLKQTKVLVTGADGFIGSHLVDHLLRTGHDVRAFVFYNSFNSWGWLEHLPAKDKKALDVFAGDIRDPYGVKKAMSGCGAVLHLAALIGIPYSYNAPDNYMETNIRGTLNVLQAARELGTTRVVHTSTSEVYGTAEFVPITEIHPLKAQSPYAASKIGADQMALSFYRSFDLPVSVIRPFNTYGPRQSARAVIPTIITQIASGKTQIQLGNLSPTRDFTYVTDLVKAFIAVAECDQAIGQVLNVGSGFEISIRQTAEMIARLMDSDIELTKDAERLRPDTSEVGRLCCSAEKLQSLTTYVMDYAGREGFERGLRETIQWFTHVENTIGYKVDRMNR
jgi:NAD dependent epimerase/dehydratase